MRAAPPVSVGLPVHNGERFLDQALTALLGQTYVDFELVISDNGSTDSTEEICRSRAAADARVRYVREDVNRGAAWNYNRVFHLARGKYFRWAAHDDLCDPAHLSRCVETFESSSQALALCYPQTILIDEDGKEIGRYEDGLDLRSPQAATRLSGLIGRLVMCNAVFGLARRDMLARTRLILPFAHADRILLAELSVLGPVWEVPEPLFYRRVHGGMSRRANRSTAAVDRWFDPDSDSWDELERTRIFAHQLRVVLSADVPTRVRLAATSAHVRRFIRRYGRVMAGELRRALRARLSRPTQSARLQLDRRDTPADPR